MALSTDHALGNLGSSTFGSGQGSAVTRVDSDITHPEYAYFAPDWALLRDVLGGERRVKEQTTKYLPMLDAQTREEYSGYLDRAVFYNATDRTLQGLLGTVFRKDPQFNGLPDDLANNPAVTLNNETLTTLCRHIATEAISMGRVGVLLDRAADPSSPSYGNLPGGPDSSGTPVNLPNVGATNTDVPYFALYTAEQILNWSVTKIDGRYQFSSILLFEADYSPDGMKTGVSSRLRLLALDGNGDYYQAVGPVDAKDYTEFQTVAMPTRRGQPLRFIPFMFFNPNSLRASVEKSPMLEIATLNLSHYQNYAALQHGRFYTAMPTYWVKGSGAQDQATPAFKVGPNTVWMLEQEDEAGILEFKGAGLGSLELALEMIERQMQSLGARLVAQQRRTAATASVSHEQAQAGERASLLAITQNLNLGMSFLVQWWMWWEEASPTAIAEASVEFNQSFREQNLTARDIRAMQSLWAEHAIPLTVLYAVFRSADIIPGEMSFEEYKALLKDPAEVPPPFEGEPKPARQIQQPSGPTPKSTPGPKQTIK